MGNMFFFVLLSTDFSQSFIQIFYSLANLHLESYRSSLSVKLLSVFIILNIRRLNERCSDSELDAGLLVFTLHHTDDELQVQTMFGVNTVKRSATQTWRL